MPILNEPDQNPKKGQIPAFEGISRFRDTSNSESLHEAIQAAAEAAVEGLKIAPGERRLFEVSRIQLEVVGNPNVKVYRVEVAEMEVTRSR